MYEVRMYTFLIAVAILMATACSSSSSSPTEETYQDTDMAVSETDPPVISNLSAEVSSAVATLVTVRWVTDVPATGWVEYGEKEEYGSSSATENKPSTEHAVTLLLPEATLFHIQAVSMVEDGSEGHSEDTTVTTGTVSAGFPTPVVKVADDPPQGMTLVSGSRDAIGCVLLIDGAGRYVWVRSDEMAENVYNARLSLDGDNVVYLFSENADRQYDQTLVRVALDGSTEERLTFQGGIYHDFIELPDGGWVYMRAVSEVVEGIEIFGDQLVEYHDGVVTIIWDSFEYFPPEKWGRDCEDGIVDSDWTHSNSLEWWDEETYLFSLKSLGVFAVNRGTGKVLWSVGYECGIENLEISNDQAAETQHGAVRTGEDALGIFVNGSTGDGSRLVEYVLDFDAREASVIWDWQSPVWFTLIQGGLERLKDGNTLSSWGTYDQGALAEIQADGVIAWQVSTIPTGTALVSHAWRVKQSDLHIPVPAN